MDDVGFGRRVVACDGVEIEAFGRASRRAGLPIVASAHPVDRFGAATAKLIVDVLGASTVCVNPRAIDSDSDSPSLEAMVDRIEAARRALALPRWVFWGMSGGGWLAQIYARRHAQALLGIVIEGACSSFSARVADPECLLCPHHAAWRERLRALGLLAVHGREVDPDPAAVWEDVDGIGAVYRRRGGPAVLVAPPPLDPDMKTAIPQLLRFDSRPWIHSIEVPTLVIAGAADPIAPAAHVRAIHNAIRGSLYIEVDGAGHVPLTERRPEVASAFRQFAATLPSFEHRS